MVSRADRGSKSGPKSPSPNQNAAVIHQVIGDLQAFFDKETVRLGDYSVGGRLCHFAQRWKSPFYQVRLKQGFTVRWLKVPPDMDFGELIPTNEEESNALRKEQLELVTKGAVELASSEKGCIFKLFLVDKKGGKRRPVVNMRPLSPFVISPHFKLEGLNIARELIRGNYWMARLDLKDAYLHVPIHPCYRKYFRYRHSGVVYQWKVLPFGFRDSPRLFQKLAVEAVTELRERGLKLVVYLDDMLLVADSEATCRAHLGMLVATLLELGFVINLEKSCLVPTRCLQFLATVIDTQTMSCSLPREKLLVFRERITAMVRRANSHKLVTVKELQSIVGTIQSMSDCFYAVRIRLNSLVELLNEVSLSRQEKTLLSPQAEEDLRWWRENIKSWNGKSLLPRHPDVVFYVDASNLGVGAFYKDRWGRESRAHSFFQQDDKTHINMRELLAAEFGLMSFATKFNWRNQCIAVRTDNMTALSYLNRMGGKKPALSRIAERIHRFALRRGIVLLAEWIPGIENVEADKVSRIEGDFSDKSLSNEIFQLIERRFGKMDLDLFATSLNKKTPHFVSLRPEPGALYVDAFSQCIPHNMQVFANPPFILLARLLAKIHREEAELVVLAPVWTSQPWWPLLLELMVEAPLLLPRNRPLYLPSEERRLGFRNGTLSFVEYPGEAQEGRFL